MNILKQIIIATLATIALSVYDHIKKQTASILKYAIALVAVFAVPYLLHWKFAYYLEAAAVWLLIVKAWAEIESIYKKITHWVDNKTHL